MDRSPEWGRRFGIALLRCVLAQQMLCGNKLTSLPQPRDMRIWRAMGRMFHEYTRQLTLRIRLTTPVLVRCSFVSFFGVRTTWPQKRFCKDCDGKKPALY